MDSASGIPNPSRSVLIHSIASAMVLDHSLPPDPLVLSGLAGHSSIGPFFGTLVLRTFLTFLTHRLGLTFHRRKPYHEPQVFDAANILLTTTSTVSALSTEYLLRPLSPTPTHFQNTATVTAPRDPSPSTYSEDHPLRFPADPSIRVVNRPISTSISTPQPSTLATRPQHLARPPSFLSRLIPTQSSLYLLKHPPLLFLPSYIPLVDFSITRLLPPLRYLLYPTLYEGWRCGSPPLTFHLFDQVVFNSSAVSSSSPPSTSEAFHQKGPSSSPPRRPLLPSYSSFQPVYPPLALESCSVSPLNPRWA